jgi:hypothetical protein
MFKSDGNVIHFSAPKGECPALSQKRPSGEIQVTTSCTLRHAMCIHGYQCSLQYANSTNQFTRRYPRTPSPSTATARIRSLRSSSPVSLTSSAPTRSPRSASSPRATRACRRRRAKARTRKMTTRMMMTTTSPISLLATTSSPRPTSNKRIPIRNDNAERNGTECVVLGRVDILVGSTTNNLSERGEKFYCRHFSTLCNFKHPSLVHCRGSWNAGMDVGCVVVIKCDARDMHCLNTTKFLMFNPRLRERN